MRKHLYIWGCLVMCLTMAACQGDDGDEPVNEKPVPEVVPAKDTQLTFTAEFDGFSATRALWNDAHVAWSAGDKVRVYPMASSSEYYTPADFSTQKGGQTADFTGKVENAVLSKTNTFYAFYPIDQVEGLYEGPIAGLKLPAEQTAVEESFGEKLNLAYARSSTLDGGKLTFKLIPALVCFKLSGDASEAIKKIRLWADKDVSGTLQVKLADGSLAGVYSGDRFVDLKGSFKNEVTYYMAVAPVNLDRGFTLSFFDASGNEFTHRIDDPTELKSSQIVDLGTIEVRAEDMVNGAVTAYQTSTKKKAIPFVVIPDGYTKSQLADYRTQAKRMLDFIFSVDPYKQYKDYFNIYILDAASGQSGADITDKKIDKDNYFNVGWSATDHSDMAADDDRVFTFVASHCPDIQSGKASIDETAVIMIVNDQRYAGKCVNTSMGRGYAMVSTANDTKMTWAGNEKAYGITNTGSWFNTALHEGGGHMFGRLADEYWSNYKLTATDLEEHLWDLPYGMNVTVDKENKVYWNELIPQKQGVKEEGKFLYVGVYEGGYALYRQGVWRSEQISCMDDNRAYFSAWQRYLIAKRIHEIVGEDFDYKTFISQDEQYNAIQKGTANRGTEGLVTTTYNGLTPNYNTSTRSNYVELSDEVYPPLPAPTFKVMKETALDMRPLRHIH